MDFVILPRMFPCDSRRRTAELPGGDLSQFKKRVVAEIPLLSTWERQQALWSLQGIGENKRTVGCNVLIRLHISFCEQFQLAGASTYM